MKTQFDAQVKVLRLDNGGEYMPEDFSSYLSLHDILHQTTYLDTPEQNGITERTNYHLLKINCVLIFTMDVPIGGNPV